MTRKWLLDLLEQLYVSESWPSKLPDKQVFFPRLDVSLESRDSLKEPSTEQDWERSLRQSTITMSRKGE